jgi:hypothetical protein
MEHNELKELLKTPAGKQLHDFILYHYNKMKSIDYLTEYETAAAMALEVKSHKKALRMLDSILCNIIAIEEEPDNKPIDPKDNFD